MRPPTRRCFIPLHAYLAISIVILGGLIYLRFLTFPLARDEIHYWSTIAKFAREPLPSVPLLRSYEELASPLGFVVLGWIEALAGHGTMRGIVLGRWFNLAITLGTLSLIAWRAPDPRKAALAALGLCLCPYFLGVGFHLYTDAIGTFFAVLALRAHLGSRFTIAAVAWILALSTRQYIIALPAGLLAYECFRKLELRGWARIASPLAAFLTLAGWMLLWGGISPEPVLTENARVSTIGALRPQYGLYALACVGAYFVIPEWLLMAKRSTASRFADRLPLVVMATILAMAFLVFPPLHNPIFVATMGYLDVAARSVLRADLPRMALFWALALVAALRWLWKPSLGFWLVLAQIGVMSLAQVAWDKYSLPLFASLWLLSAGWNRSAPPTRAPASTTTDANGALANRLARIIREAPGRRPRGRGQDASGGQEAAKPPLSPSSSG